MSYIGILSLRFEVCCIFAIIIKYKLNCYFNNSWNSVFLLFPNLLAIIHVSIMSLKLKVCSVTVQEILLFCDRLYFCCCTRCSKHLLYILHNFFIFHAAMRNRESKKHLQNIGKI